MCYKKLFVNKKLTVHEALEELRNSDYAENACLKRIVKFVETSERLPSPCSRLFLSALLTDCIQPLHMKGC